MTTSFKIIRAFTVLPSLRLNERTCVLPFSTNDFSIVLVIFLPAYSFQTTNVHPSLKREQPYPFLPSIICPEQPGEGHEASTSRTPELAVPDFTVVPVLEAAFAVEVLVALLLLVTLLPALLPDPLAFPLPLPLASSPKASAAAGACTRTFQ